MRMLDFNCGGMLLTVFKAESDMIYLRYICPFTMSGSEVEKRQRVNQVGGHNHGLHEIDIVVEEMEKQGQVHDIF